MYLSDETQLAELADIDTHMTLESCHVLSLISYCDDTVTIIIMNCQIVLGC